MNPAQNSMPTVAWDDRDFLLIRRERFRRMASPAVKSSGVAAFSL